MVLPMKLSDAAAMQQFLYATDNDNRFMYMKVATPVASSNKRKAESPQRKVTTSNPKPSPTRHASPSPLKKKQQQQKESKPVLSRKGLDEAVKYCAMRLVEKSTTSDMEPLLKCFGVRDQGRNCGRK